MSAVVASCSTTFRKVLQPEERGVLTTSSSLVTDTLLMTVYYTGTTITRLSVNETLCVCVCVGGITQKSTPHSLTFLVPKEQGLLCWIRPLEGGVVIMIYATGQVGCSSFCHRHILDDGELTLGSYRTNKETNILFIMQSIKQPKKCE